MKQQRRDTATITPSHTLFVSESAVAHTAHRTSVLQVLLSQKEREVLYWLTQGKTGYEISVILNISVGTVRGRIRNIIRKLDASNIPHAVARAFRSGILER